MNFPSMPASARLAKSGLLLLASTLLLTACTTAGNFQRGGGRAATAPTPLVAAPTTQVQSSALPGIGESGDPLLIAATSPIDGESNIPNIVQDPNLPSIVDVPTSANIVGRDLTGALTKEKMIGGWTIASGQGSCRLFLTLTAKDGRYRAATPACDTATFTDVATWQLVGDQVQLFSAAGSIIGSMARTGDRFVGTMAGGVAASIYS